MRPRKRRRNIDKRISRTRSLEIIALADLRNGVEVSYMENYLGYLIEKEKYEECAGIRRAIKTFQDEVPVQ
jgi:protein-arginine kinase activator protein McsA